MTHDKAQGGKAYDHCEAVAYAAKKIENESPAWISPGLVFSTEELKYSSMGKYVGYAKTAEITFTQSKYNNLIYNNMKGMYNQLVEGYSPGVVSNYKKLIGAYPVLELAAVKSGYGINFSTGYGEIMSPDVLKNNLKLHAKLVLFFSNVERSKNGLMLLEYDDKLQAAAEKRSQELAYNYSHSRPDGQSCFTVAYDYGVESFIYSENIGINYGPVAAVKVWMNTPGYRFNMMCPSARFLGTGVSPSADRFCYVQLLAFGEPKGGKAEKTKAEKPLATAEI